VFYESDRLDTRNTLNTNRFCERILLNVTVKGID